MNGENPIQFWPIYWGYNYFTPIYTPFGKLAWQAGT